MYTLYYSPGACSMAVHIALNECNEPVTLERVNTKQPTPEFLKLNPLGAIPVLVDGDTVISEGAAILIHILEKHKSPLLPASGKERDAALQWLMICNATLHPAYSRCFFINRNVHDEALKKQLLTQALATINKLWGIIETTLTQTPYLAGQTLTAADILMAVIANWKGYLPQPEAVIMGPHTKKLLQSIIARPAYKKALETEKVEYKAAA